MPRAQGSMFRPEYLRYVLTKGKVCVYNAESMRGRRKSSVSQSNLMSPELALKRIFQQNMNIRPAALDAANAGEQQRAKTLLFSIAPEMLEMLLLQFGHLGFNVEEHRPRFCATCLPQFTTESIFEQYDIGQMVPVNSPLASIDSDWMRQLIDIWFSIHPVPVLISKTLLLQSIKDGVYDQALLAILLSEAMATLVTHVSESHGPSLLVEGAALAGWSIS
ncbi:hypothetical protein BDW60DRAFT_209794 [Aspergillus nidulans var. acristatus]